MAGFAQEGSPATVSGPKTSSKRRKIRQGTHSCWECKRRKTRCIFTSSEDVSSEQSCIGCQHRRVPCVKQDRPENFSPAKTGNRNLADRLSRMERVMKDFVDSGNNDAANQEERQITLDQLPAVSDARKTHSYHPVTSVARAPLTPAESLEGSGPTSSFFTDVEASALQHLWVAFPTEADVKILLRESARTALYTHMINTQPHVRLTPATLVEPHPPIELPDFKTHPVNLARLMLIFAITLQSPSGENFSGLSESPDALSHRLVTAATTLVTTKEELLGSVESLICIIFEVVYKMNRGNLRQAWAVNRRAMTLAQMMGLHRSPVLAQKRINSEFEANPANPEFMWFRIVYLDRHLSLLLGLPHGTSDRDPAAASILQHETPIGKFERLLTTIAFRVLERNEHRSHSCDISRTQSIDSELLAASQSMPADFWRPANFQNLMPGSPETLLETVRLASQVYYFGLLIQLHLPYMIYGTGSNIELKKCSKMTCISAGREIIVRFIAHRSFNPTSACSRPTDFFTLLAAMTLLLAHLDAHHCEQRKGMNLLAHQRLSDRAMLGQTVEIMETIISRGEDVALAESTKLIQSLLAIEADAAEGKSYTGDHNHLPEDIKKYILWIIRHRSSSREPCFEIATAQSLRSSLAGYPNGEPIYAPPPSDSGFATLPHMSHQHEGNSLNQLHRYPQQPMSPYTSTGQNDTTLQAHDELPSTTAGVDDWAFQGVDMAFFESLMRDVSYIDTTVLK